MPALDYSVSDFVSYFKIRFSDLNAKYNDITTLLNTTKLDDSNIQDSSIAASDKFIDSTMTEAKLSSSVSAKLKRVGNQARNLGLTLSGGTLTFTGQSATLSSTDYADFWVPSTTGGEKVQLKLTADVTLNDDANASSDLTGFTFGSSPDAWVEDRPFFLYAVNSDDSDSGLALAISLNPVATVTPAATLNGYKGNTPSTQSELNFVFLSDSDLTSSHASKPCVRIGGIRMQKSGSNDWTIQSLSPASGDGIRKDPFKSKWFTFPVGQNGADVTYHILATVMGTPATWATPANIVYKYCLNIDNGFVDCGYDTSDAGNATAGSASTSVVIATPYNATPSDFASGTKATIEEQYSGNTGGYVTIGGSNSTVPLSITHDNVVSATDFSISFGYHTIFSEDI